MPQEKPIKTKLVQASSRTLIQQASRSIRNVSDALVELVTNSDDRYQLLGTSGRIEIEVERKRGEPSIIKVRDFADGMTSDVMDSKLAIMGERVSGMESGYAVRGTNSRGAKDIAALGLVRFESIAEDARFHCSEITGKFNFRLFPSKKVTRSVRRILRIPHGTGTLVSLFVESRHRVPLHKSMLSNLSSLVALRDILKDPDREIVLVDRGKNRSDSVKPPRYSGHNRLKVSFDVPGYPGARAKLVVNRSNKRFEREHERCRLGGILIKSRHAVHEATYFDRSLEGDPHALWFYGQLTCEYIEELWNEYDENFLSGREQTEANPIPILDPSRRTGLDREHPFVAALFKQVLSRFRPLVEEEKRREENQRTAIESEETRKRLDALEKAAIEFMKEFDDDEEPARALESQKADSRFLEKGYSLSPPFAKMVVGDKKTFSFQVSQKAFPEMSEGSKVHVDPFTDDISIERTKLELVPHERRKDILVVRWKVGAREVSSVTGMAVSAGTISAEALVEVLGSESDRYSDIDNFGFRRKKYRMRTEAKKKRIKLFAPIEMFPEDTNVEVSITGDTFSVRGQHFMRRKPDLEIAMCSIGLISDGTEAKEIITARASGHEDTAEIQSVKPLGAGLEITLEDMDLGNQRYRWQQNVLEIAARHASVNRYLGPKSENYPGQNSMHFRLLLAEIVAEAVCARIMDRQEELTPGRFGDSGWSDYYAQFCKLMTKFLPVTHKLQCPEEYGELPG
ncbi:MAG: hypothetical protein KAW14_13290 [Candidatus Aegiribacteria sp.]|nr:hypothetical protein [Candidatus Aegiribacteria sp.]